MFKVSEKVLWNKSDISSYFLLSWFVRKISQSEQISNLKWLKNNIMLDGDVQRAILLEIWKSYDSHWLMVTFLRFYFTRITRT